MLSVSPRGLCGVIKYSALMAIILAVAQLTPPAAHACITRVLSPPEAIGAFLANKPAEPDGDIAQLAELFQRDKIYYDAIVIELCGLRMWPADGGGQRRAQINRQIMTLLINKWTPDASGQPKSP